jgi:hypothetical protein
MKVSNREVELTVKQMDCPVVVFTAVVGENNGKDRSEEVIAP